MGYENISFLSGAARMQMEGLSMVRFSICRKLQFVMYLSSASRCPVWYSAFFEAVTAGSEVINFSAVMRMYSGWAITYESFLKSDCVTLFDQGCVM